MKEVFNNFITTNKENIYGLTDELKSIYIYKAFKEENNNILVLASSLYETKKFYNKLKTYTKDVFFFPMDEFLTSEAIAISPEFKAQRLQVLNKIKENKKCIVVTNLMGYLRFLPTKNLINDLEMIIKTNSNFNRNTLIEKLTTFGYQKESIVSSTGEFSVRGFIIDIFPFNYDKPIRIEFYGNKVDEIREFDNETQLSTNKIKEVKIVPYKEVLSNEKSSIYELLDNPLLFKIDSEVIKNSYQRLQEEIFNYKTTHNIPKEKTYMYKKEDIFIKRQVNLDNIGYSKEFENYSSCEIESFDGNEEKLTKFIKEKSKNYKISFVTDNKETIKYLTKNFKELKIINYKTNEGFIINNNIYISDAEIFGKKQMKDEQNIIKIGTKIKKFTDINKGDYVVHIDHGIGIYGGVKTINVQGFKKDFILINYKGNDKVYVPVEKINTIFKYSEKEGSKPKINNLNSYSWTKTKENVRQKIRDTYKELLILYRKRAQIKVEPYLSFPEEKKFASEFEYEETPDQINCIEEIDRDLMSTKPMDRLLCGDVGYGKTEVAFRAMFKTVMNGYQVAYLCPTTILSKQQYNVALKRFQKFNLNIRLLNRFTTLKEVQNILKELENGKVDIIFGTHRLFNQKIKYFDLGLLIIDEEQRFGVLQKEKIKKIKKNINVLTLSATPIPRTLKMSMAGLKDLSILDTPPENRYPVQTYVVEENLILIKDIIYKEMSRNGQVYLLYNNVSQIEIMSNKVKNLVPDAKICFAHGQMPKKDLEKRIAEFVDYKYDVLICSTIIETGIDIPNVNSLIIFDSQNFGLSQLYQLRGRIGRSDKIGYCYLMYNKNKVLSETAIKRLKAIQEFTELGSGYKIALRDLSIRGAGELLGSEQAGFIDSVGFNLYAQMLKEIMVEPSEPPIVKEEKNQTLLNIDTHIPLGYVSDENIRIEMHNLINNIEDLETLNSVKEELEDRFGKTDEKTLIYMYQVWLEKLLETLSIKQIYQTKDQIQIIIPESLVTKLNKEKFFLKSQNINSKFKLKFERGRIVINLKIKEAKKHYVYDFIDLLLVIKTYI